MCNTLIFTNKDSINSINKDTEVIHINDGNKRTFYVFLVAWQCSQTRGNEDPFGYGSLHRRQVECQPISRVLSWTIIHLGLPSPTASSGLPRSNTGRIKGSLFGLAPGGVYLATTCYHVRGALLPHPFTLTDELKLHRRSTLCCTFRRLSPPRRYLAPCPMEPGLSSRRARPAIAQLTLERQCRAITPRHKSVTGAAHSQLGALLAFKVNANS